MWGMGRVWVGGECTCCKGTGSGKCPCVMKELLKLQPWLRDWEKGKQTPLSSKESSSGGPQRPHLTKE